MMGERRVMQEALFYGFSLERHVPDDHLLRKIDQLVQYMVRAREDAVAYLPTLTETPRDSGIAA